MKDSTPSYTNGTWYVYSYAPWHGGNNGGDEYRNWIVSTSNGGGGHINIYNAGTYALTPDLITRWIHYISSGDDWTDQPGFFTVTTCPPTGGGGAGITDASGVGGAMQGMAAGIVLIIVNAIVVFFTSVMGIITVLAVCVGLVWFFIRKTRHAGGGYNHYHAHGAKNYKDYLKKTNLPF
jgi:hypothetical protein